MAYILLLVALTLSSVAAFYSVVGLAAIFSGAFIAVIIMGSTLEVAKVLTTLWLHRHWSQVPILLKTYLTSAVIVLMLITSMGIFGFLSKAHIEQEYTQASLAIESESLKTELADVDSAINEAKLKLQQLSSNSWFDEIKTRIDTEQQELISLQQQRTQLLAASAAKTDAIQAEITNAESLLASRKISALQQLLGLKADGQYGGSTRSAYEQYVSSRKAKLEQADTSILDTQIVQAQARIDNLQSQLVSPEDTKVQIAKLQADLDALVKKRDTVSEQLSATDKQITAFAVEVGPITFISELFFDSTDESSSRTTVRMLIFTIIAVFDPLAILLVVAASMTIPNKQETVEDQLPAVSRLQELIRVDNNTLFWKEREDKAFNARWANKPLGKTATIDGKSYKTPLIYRKMQK